MTIAAYSRPLLTLALLVPVLALTACLDESCNFVGPSETTSSHEPGAATSELVVDVYYVTYEGDKAPDSITVSTRGGSIQIRRDASGTLVIGNLKKDDFVTFFASSSNGGTSASCRYKAKASIAGAEVDFRYDADDGRWDSSCVGW